MILDASTLKNQTQVARDPYPINDAYLDFVAQPFLSSSLSLLHILICSLCKILLTSSSKQLSFLCV